MAGEVASHNTRNLRVQQTSGFGVDLPAISAVVKDNVWLDRQIYNLYPNIYVMFHARVGLKKGSAYQYGETVSAGS